MTVFPLIAEYCPENNPAVAGTGLQKHSILQNSYMILSKKLFAKV